jgi:predicted RNase H-like HicB family nuclease
MRVRGYKVEVEQLNGVWAGTVPRLPEVRVTGLSRVETEILLVEAIALHLKERRPEPKCTCVGFLGRRDGCPAHGRIETRVELEELRQLRDAVKRLRWKALDGMDKAADVLVERESWENLHGKIRFNNS